MKAVSEPHRYQLLVARVVSCQSLCRASTYQQWNITVRFAFWALSARCINKLVSDRSRDMTLETFGPFLPRDATVARMAVCLSNRHS